MYDILIVGAGPAGATLARLLGERYRVLLADRRQLGEPHVEGRPGKTCGGLLAPAAQRELARQGLALPSGVSAGSQLFAVRVADRASKLTQLYQRFYLNVDREAFDRWLVSLVPASVERVWGWSLDRLECEPGATLAHFRTSCRGHASVRARLVVGADGAASIVRRLAFPRAPLPTRYAAIQGAFESAIPAAEYGAFFEPDLTDFYCWSVPKGGVTLIGGAFPIRGSRERYAALVERLRADGACRGRELRREAAMLLRPAGLSELVLARPGVALCGEAAGFVSPSSGEGISYALRSARVLARAAADGLDVHGRYAFAAAPLAAEVLAKAAKGAVIGNGLSRRTLMRLGAGSLGLGLAEGLPLAPPLRA